ncbi:MAG: hypothetical protein IJY89_06975 [Clostridia bacterium]|nr:hypothetical protein [Clostridia bacterium]
MIDQLLPDTHIKIHHVKIGKLAFLTGKLEPVSDRPEKLLAAYTADFGEDQ